MVSDKEYQGCHDIPEYASYRMKKVVFAVCCIFHGINGMCHEIDNL